MYETHTVNELLGKTLKSVTHDNSHYGDSIVFVTTDNVTYRLCHEQDCCESVYVDDIAGDLSDLEGSPLTMAEEVSSIDPPSDFKPKDHESFTWTFYKFATVNGYVTIRWFGESNGYYSERVDFVKDASRQYN